MLSNPLGSPLATGYTAEVYAWSEGYVLKLFRATFPLGAIDHEARVARAVHNAGLPAPAVGATVQVAGRHGIIYERVVGPSMLELMVSRPWRLFRYARHLAELQGKLHEIEAVQGVPDQRSQLTRKIGEAEILSPDLQAAALRMLAGLQGGNRLCHGDLHPGNVLMAEDGPVVIDWIDATCGNSLADVARSSLLMGEAPIPDEQRRRSFLGLFRDWFHAAYIRHYFRLRPGGREEIARWLVVNAAARLSEGVPEQQALLAFVEAELGG